MEGWERAATAVTATTKGSNADKIWDQSLSPTSPSPPPTTTLSSTPNLRNEDFPSLWLNPTLPPWNLEVEQAKLDIEQPFETLWREKEERVRKRGWKDRGLCFCFMGVNGEKTGMEAIEKGKRGVKRKWRGCEDWRRRWGDYENEIRIYTYECEWEQMKK